MGGWKAWKGHRNVVSLRRGAGRELNLSPLRQIEAYWAALCPDGEVPLRSAIDPRGLENVLRYSFVLERVAPGVARFRIAGQHLIGLAGMEVRGMPVTALMTRTARPRMGAVLEHLFDTPAVAELTLSGERATFSRRLGARMLLLPLKSDSGQISRALGALVSDGDTGATPGRFNLDDATFRPIPGGAARPERASDREFAPLDEPTHQFAEAQRRFRGSAPHLRVVSSRD